VALGYASFDGRDYRLRPRVLELGMAYFSSHSFVDIANPILKAAADRAQEPCSMAVLDGSEIVYVARHTAERMMSITITIGKRYPAHSTSLGWVLLGGLDDDELSASSPGRNPPGHAPHRHRQGQLREADPKGRIDGFCQAESQLEVGILSIAVPVRDRGGRSSPHQHGRAVVAPYAGLARRDLLADPARRRRRDRIRAGQRL
jgi:IclR family transcriptional regulator, pca regulon regulatory protein